MDLKYTPSQSGHLKSLKWIPKNCSQGGAKKRVKGPKQVRTCEVQSRPKKVLFKCRLVMHPLPTWVYTVPQYCPKISFRIALKWTELKSNFSKFSGGGPPDPPNHFIWVSTSFVQYATFSSIPFQSGNWYATKRCRFTACF